MAQAARESVIIVTSSSLAQLHDDGSLTGRPLKPSSCCFHATSRVEWLTAKCK